ncbi:MAG TPA: histidine ammonia-lyase [Chroococcales cyanobacterium]
MSDTAEKNKVREVFLNGEELTLAQVWEVAEKFSIVRLAPGSLERVLRSRKQVEGILANNEIIYGITTGFGQFKDRRIPTEDVKKLQRNLILSHAAAVGAPFPVSVTRAIMLLRANALAKGFSGIRPETLQLLIDCLNKKVHPILPSQGSVGSSGDLAILAHLALVLIGEGQAEFEGKKYQGREALEKAFLSPVELEAKEGLALINGTQAQTALGCLVMQKANNLAKVADIACAMSLEALKGTSSAYRPELHALRPHPGQIKSAANLLKLLDKSEILDSHRDCGMVQDAYSLRCAPQVHGASRDCFEYVEKVLKTEINSATDNPLLFFETGEVINGGHFHGQPVAIAMDFAGIGLSELASISERRTERLVNPNYSNGLPAFLTPQGGLNSGYMIAQYTAASLVSENKSLAHPASVDSIPTSAGQEDHVSMGTTAARQAYSIVENVEKVLAIEILCAAQALDFRKPLSPGLGALYAHECLRETVAFLEEDRVTSLDIELALEWIRSGKLVERIEKTIGCLD